MLSGLPDRNVLKSVALPLGLTKRPLMLQNATHLETVAATINAHNLCDKTTGHSFAFPKQPSLVSVQLRVFLSRLTVERGCLNQVGPHFQQRVR